LKKNWLTKNSKKLKLEIKRISGAKEYIKGSSVSGTAELLQSQLVDRAPKSFEFKVGGNNAGSETPLSLDKLIFK